VQRQVPTVFSLANAATVLTRALLRKTFPGVFALCTKKATMVTTGIPMTRDLRGRLCDGILDEGS
jgi:hypothetical protein